MRNKFVIIIIILVAAIAMMGAGIYLRSRLAQNSATPPADNGSNATGGLPNAGGIGSSGSGASNGNAQLPQTETKNISPVEIVDYFVDKSGDVTEVNLDGQVLKVNSSSSTLLSNKKVPDLLHAVFSPTGEKILFSQIDPDSLNPHWSVYDVQKNSWRDLQIDARSAYWSPDGKKIAFFARRLTTTALSTLDLTSTSSKPVTLLTLAAEDLDLNWIQPTRMVIGERASATFSSSLWSFDLSTKNLRLLKDDVQGYDLIWGAAEGALLSSGGGAGRDFSLVDNNLSKIQSFTFQTLPSKCAFYRASTSTSENLVCAVPKDASAFGRAKLPDDYQKESLMTNDNFYLIGLNDNSFKPLTNNSVAAVDATKIKIFGNSAYFINRWDKKLYSLSLGN